MEEAEGYIRVPTLVHVCIEGGGGGRVGGGGDRGLPHDTCPATLWEMVEGKFGVCTNMSQAVVLIT